MLLQITNKCHMMCPHCLQDSKPEGKHMTLETFNKVLQFMLYCGINYVTISGGEPTEHPDIEKICQVLHNHKIRFSICSNGMWAKDDSLITKVYGILAMSNCMGMQVYSNPKWYKEHEYIISRKSTTFSHPKIAMPDNDILSMQDIGRARTCEAAKAEALKSPYFMSCLNGCLIAKQAKDLRHFFALFVNNGILCKPLIDYRGIIHMSESWLCPDCGDIMNDTYLQIWCKIASSKPCLGCINSKKFMESNRLDIIHSRKLLKL